MAGREDSRRRSSRHHHRKRRHSQKGYRLRGRRRQIRRRVAQNDDDATVFEKIDANRRPALSKIRTRLRWKEPESTLSVSQQPISVNKSLQLPQVPTSEKNVQHSVMSMQTATETTRTSLPMMSPPETVASQKNQRTHDSRCHTKRRKSDGKLRGKVEKPLTTRRKKKKKETSSRKKNHKMFDSEKKGTNLLEQPPPERIPIVNKEERIPVIMTKGKQISVKYSRQKISGEEMKDNRGITEQTQEDILDQTQEEEKEIDEIMEQTKEEKKEVDEKMDKREERKKESREKIDRKWEEKISEGMHYPQEEENTESSVSGEEGRFEGSDREKRVLSMEELSASVSSDEKTVSDLDEAGTSSDVKIIPLGKANDVDPSAIVPIKRERYEVKGRKNTEFTVLQSNRIRTTPTTALDTQMTVRSISDMVQSKKTAVRRTAAARTIRKVKIRGLKTTKGTSLKPNEPISASGSVAASRNQTAATVVSAAAPSTITVMPSKQSSQSKPEELVSTITVLTKSTVTGTEDDETIAKSTATAAKGTPTDLITAKSASAEATSPPVAINAAAVIEKGGQSTPTDLVKSVLAEATWPPDAKTTTAITVKTGQSTRTDLITAKSASAETVSPPVAKKEAAIKVRNIQALPYSPSITGASTSVLSKVFDTSEKKEMAKVNLLAACMGPESDFTETSSSPVATTSSVTAAPSEQTSSVSPATSEPDVSAGQKETSEARKSILTATTTKSVTTAASAREDPSYGTTTTGSDCTETSSSPVATTSSVTAAPSEQTSSVSPARTTSQASSSSKIINTAHENGTSRTMSAVRKTIPTSTSGIPLTLMSNTTVTCAKQAPPNGTVPTKHRGSAETSSSLPATTSTNIAAPSEQESSGGTMAAKTCTPVNAGSGAISADSGMSAPGSPTLASITGVLAAFLNIIAPTKSSATEDSMLATQGAHVMKSSSKTAPCDTSVASTISESDQLQKPRDLDITQDSSDLTRKSPVEAAKAGESVKVASGLDLKRSG